MQIEVSTADSDIQLSEPKTEVKEVVKQTEPAPKEEAKDQRLMCLKRGFSKAGSQKLLSGLNPDVAKTTKRRSSFSIHNIVKKTPIIPPSEFQRKIADLYPFFMSLRQCLMRDPVKKHIELKPVMKSNSGLQLLNYNSEKFTVIERY